MRRAGELVEPGPGSPLARRMRRPAGRFRGPKTGAPFFLLPPRTAVPATQIDTAGSIQVGCSGAATAEQREVFFSAGRALVSEQGAEAVMLGGTDLALAFAGQDPGFPVFDCAAVHADAIADAARR